MNTITLLDHGYTTKIEHWGSDEQIIEAARMSTGKGFKGWGPTPTDELCPGWSNADCVAGVVQGGPGCKSNGNRCGVCGGTGRVNKAGDERLLRYLWTNKHATPFEMAGLTIEVQAPIFVFRQWHRHRTQSYNEMSARYTPLPALDYVPTVDRLVISSTKNKQAGKAKGAAALTEAGAEVYRQGLMGLYTVAQAAYLKALAMGVPKELARIHLPVARYSRMRASANLRNWIGFLTLRLDPHAQYEIRVYAEAVGTFIKDAFPRTWELFAEGLNA